MSQCNFYHLRSADVLLQHQAKINWTINKLKIVYTINISPPFNQRTFPFSALLLLLLATNLSYCIQCRDWNAHNLNTIGPDYAVIYLTNYLNLKVYWKRETKFLLKLKSCIRIQQKYLDMARKKQLLYPFPPLTDALEGIGVRNKLGQQTSKSSSRVTGRNKVRKFIQQIVLTSKELLGLPCVNFPIHTGPGVSTDLRTEVTQHRK